MFDKKKKFARCYCFHRHLIYSQVLVQVIYKFDNVSAYMTTDIHFWTKIQIYIYYERNPIEPHESQINIMSV